MPFRQVRLFIAVIVMTGFSLLNSLSTPVSVAVTQATRAVTLQTSTTNWGAVMSNASSAASAQPYVLYWAPIQGLQNNYTKVTNIGALQLNGFTISIDSVDSNGNRNNVPRTTVTLCIGATWNAVTDSCAGTTQVLGTVGSGSLSSTTTLGPNASVSVQLSITKTSKVQWITTVNTSVTRQQIRSSTVTNS